MKLLVNDTVVEAKIKELMDSRKWQGDLTKEDISKIMGGELESASIVQTGNSGIFRYNGRKYDYFMNRRHNVICVEYEEL